jgi:hypothetical protein
VTLYNNNNNNNNCEGSRRMANDEPLTCGWSDSLS